MSTAAQTAANIANAQSSTGPRTEEGKATSAKNSVTLGLYSGDFIRPNEHQEHEDLKAALHAEISPRGATEEILFNEIVSAAWRLSRCAKVESHLANYLAAEGEDAYILDAMEACGNIAEKIQKSVDRARAQSHRLFHKCRSRTPETPDRTQRTRGNRTRDKANPIGTRRNAQKRPMPLQLRTKIQTLLWQKRPGRAKSSLTNHNLPSRDSYGAVTKSRFFRAGGRGVPFKVCSAVLCVSA